jgi:hypothetical protein
MNGALNVLGTIAYYVFVIASLCAADRREAHGAVGMVILQGPR